MAKFSKPLDAREVARDSKIQITLEHFKMWLMSFDHDRDGRISLDELRAAIRDRGVWFSAWKSRRAMGQADINGNGYIDEDEIPYLVNFANRDLGFNIVI